MISLSAILPLNQASVILYDDAGLMLAFVLCARVASSALGQNATHDLAGKQVNFSKPA